MRIRIKSIPNARNSAHWHGEGGGIGGWFKKVLGLSNDSTPTDSIPQGMDYNELRLRQAYAESKFDNDAKSPRGAVGMFQIMPAVLTDYNKANGTSLTMENLKEQATNTAVRDWYMAKLQGRPWVTNGGANDSIQYAKALSGYNYGGNNTLKALNKAKAEGVDIYNGWDWLNYLPAETSDYINFILRGQDNSILRNDSAYKARKALKSKEVEALNQKSTGGPMYPFSFSRRPLPPVRY